MVKLYFNNIIGILIIINESWIPPNDVRTTNDSTNELIISKISSDFLKDGRYV